MGCTSTKSVFYLNNLNSLDMPDLSEMAVVRTDGLLGDNVIASTAFETIMKITDNKPIAIYSTYHHRAERLLLLRDLYSELFGSDIIRLIMHYGRGHGPLEHSEVNVFRSCGCKHIFDCAPWESVFQSLKRGKPMLGRELSRAWSNNKATAKTVGIFRLSRFHNHYPLRNRPWREWLAIEGRLQKLGFNVLLFGWDDTLPTTAGVVDYRRRLTVHQTLKYMAECSVLISTTTFAPLFCQYYIPCFVLSDPRDIPNLRLKWQVLPDYNILNAKSNYMEKLFLNIEYFFDENSRKDYKEVE